jgi:hypothetical protein
VLCPVSEPTSANNNEHLSLKEYEFLRRKTKFEERYPRK